MFHAIDRLSMCCSVGRWLVIVVVVVVVSRVEPLIEYLSYRDEKRDNTHTP